MNQIKDNHDMMKFKIFDQNYTLPYDYGSNKTKGDILIAATILFAEKGYAGVSMRDLADAVNIQAASLYNHFASKEILWQNVLTHAKDLYLLFFEQVREQIKKANTFAEVLQVIFEEPEKMNNHFTCYAFALAQSEQFRDEYAREIYNDYLVKYAIDFVQEQFDNCIKQGLVPEFDTWTTACIYSHGVLAGINVMVQKLLGKSIPYDPNQMIASLHQLILNMATAGCRDTR